MAIRAPLARTLLCFVIALSLLVSCARPVVTVDKSAPAPKASAAVEDRVTPTTGDLGAEPTEAEVAQAAAALDAEGKLPVEIASAKMYPTLDQAVANAKIVLTGKVVGKGQVFNGARDPNDPTRLKADWYTIIQLYRVKVDQYIKGTGPDEIWVRQMEGDLDSTVPHSLVNIRAAQSKHDHVPLENGKRYAFLISEKVLVRELGNLETYVQAPNPPKRFILNDDGTAEVQATSASVKSQYPKQKTTELETKLKAASMK
jgi:hypothetical protein